MVAMKSGYERTNEVSIVKSEGTCEDSGETHVRNSYCPQDRMLQYPDTPMK